MHESTSWKYDLNDFASLFDVLQDLFPSTLNYSTNLQKASGNTCWLFYALIVRRIDVQLVDVILLATRDETANVIYLLFMANSHKLFKTKQTHK